MVIIFREIALERSIDLVSERVKELREKMGLTQEKFAARIGVHKITVSRWECGVITPRGMALKALERLFKKYDIK